MQVREIRVLEIKEFDSLDITIAEHWLIGYVYTSGTHTGWCLHHETAFIMALGWALKDNLK